MSVFEPCRSRRLLRSQLLWFGFWVAITAVGVCLHPNKSGHGTHEQLGLPPCPSVLIFDRPCPGCGLTTSWTALIHGDFAYAFHAHPLGPPMYLIFTLSALFALYGWWKGKRFATDTPEFNRVMIVTVIVFLAFGFARMALTPHFATGAERWFAITH